MKSTWWARLSSFVMALSLVVGLSLAVAAHAADTKNGSQSNPTQKQLLKMFDKNGDGKLSAKEKATKRMYIAKLREQKALNRNAAALSN